MPKITSLHKKAKQLREEPCIQPSLFNETDNTENLTGTSYLSLKTVTHYKPGNTPENFIAIIETTSC